MEWQETRALIVEDNEDHRLLIQALIEGIDTIAVSTDYASSYEEALSRCDAERYDILLLDYMLGEADGLDLLRTVRAKGNSTPVIFLTSMGGEAVAVEAMKAGATDYLRKGRLSTELLGASIRHALELHNQEQRRKLAEEALQRAKDELEVEVEERTAELRQANEQLQIEIRERKQAQKVLARRNRELEDLNKIVQRTERLAAAGEMATGVAHQINNPLTTIVAHTFLLMRKLTPDDPAYASVVAIKEAVEQAGSVVHRLLDLARSTPYLLRPVELNLSIQNSVSLVRAQIQSSIQIVTQLDEKLPLIQASQEHLEDIWVNLLLNARDAIGGSENGIINIISNRAKDNTVQVVVSDNGAGIPPEHLEIVFDPFFTTKEYGTGLGLAICRDVVTHHGGSIQVTSDGLPGHGTRFTVTLPVSASMDGRYDKLQR